MWVYGIGFCNENGISKILSLKEDGVCNIYVLRKNVIGSMKKYLQQLLYLYKDTLETNSEHTG